MYTASVVETPFTLYPLGEKAPNKRMSAKRKPEAGKTPDPVTFEDLLVAVGKNRDRDAFVRLFEHYAPRVKSFLMKGGMN